LKEISLLIEKRMSKVKHVSDVVNSVKEGKPEYHIVIDKDKAFKYGLTAAQIASTIKTFYPGNALWNLPKKWGRDRHHRTPGRRKTQQL